MSARDVVEGIVDDLKDRAGLDEMWNGIDEETQQEIIEAWIDIVRKEICK